MVTDPPSPRSGKALLIRTAYFAVVAGFLWIFSQFHVPGKAYTYVLMFGDQRSASYLPELQAIDYYQMENSYGYDAQHYAQIAMRPDLEDPELARAVDNLPYRARRILLSWVAYALAGGDPVVALHIFSLQNIVAWVLLAVVMLRWFPPDSLQNFARWAGVLFSFGLCFSVRGALVDGPSLLLIALALWMLETKQPWGAAGVLAIAGLGKETNVLGSVALLDPGARGWKAWLRMAIQGSMVVAPLAVWMVYLTATLGTGGGTGSRNFELPLQGFFIKWMETVGQLVAEGQGSVAMWSLMMIIALTVQLSFFALRPRWTDPWWRVGAAYSILMIFLGGAVWEGYPGAASRVLLPMTLAFNVLVPRTRRWLPLLLMGNLTVFALSDVLRPAGRESYRIEGRTELAVNPDTGRGISITYDDSWYQAERSRFEYWRWSPGDAEIEIFNPRSEPIYADVRFTLRVADERTVRLLEGDVVVWEGLIKPGPGNEVEIPGHSYPPGATRWRFETDHPPITPDGEDLRPITFNLRDLKLKIVRPPTS